MTSAQGRLSDSQLVKFESVVLNFLSQGLTPWNNNGYRVTVMKDVSAVEQHIAGGRRLLRRLQNARISIVLEVDGIVSPDADGAYSFDFIISQIFANNSLVLERDLAQQGIVVTFS
jgi:hypothetical protein